MKNSRNPDSMPGGNNRRKSITDFIQFEDATSVIWPWAASAEALLQNETLLLEVEKTVCFDESGNCDTDELYAAMDRIAGINPAIEPKTRPMEEWV